MFTPLTMKNSGTVDFAGAHYYTYSSSDRMSPASEGFRVVW